MRLFIPAGQKYLPYKSAMKNTSRCYFHRKIVYNVCGQEDNAMYIKRTVEKTIVELAGQFPCIAIYGPRQCGKSTTAEHLFGDIRQVTMDDLDDRKLANENPRLFLETYGWPLLIDEIQKAPALFDYIKIVIDEENKKRIKEDKKKELMYVLTGSSQFELQQGIADSLAGRCAIVDMSFFSMAEINGSEGLLFDPDIAVLLERERTSAVPYRTRKEIFEDIFLGGIPDVVLQNAGRDAYFRSYVNTYIEKDVRRLISQNSEVQFRNFLSLIALRTAQELKYDVLSNAAGIDVRTCRRWISVLERSGIIYLLQPYMADVSNRIIKAPKLYFMDTGLCAYLCKWPNAEMLENGAMAGAFFETYIVSELIKNSFAYNIDPNWKLFYYRDIDQKEIDILYLKNDTIYPIEIKKSSSPAKPAKNFNVLKKYGQPVGKGIIIDTCDKIRPVNEVAYTCPVGILAI